MAASTIATSSVASFTSTAVVATVSIIATSSVAVAFAIPPPQQPPLPPPPPPLQLSSNKQTSSKILCSLISLPNTTKQSPNTPFYLSKPPTRETPVGAEKDGGGKGEGEKKPATAPAAAAGGGGDKKDDGGGKVVSVYKMDMHCVEDVKTDCLANKLTVTGKVDPGRVKARVEEYMKKQVDIVSPQPKKEGGGGGGGGSPPAGDKKGGGGGGEKAEKKAEEKKPEEKKPEEKKPAPPKEVSAAATPFQPGLEVGQVCLLMHLVRTHYQHHLVLEQYLIWQPIRQSGEEISLNM